MTFKLSCRSILFRSLRIILDRNHLKFSPDSAKRCWPALFIQTSALNRHLRICFGNGLRRKALAWTKADLVRLWTRAKLVCLDEMDNPRE